MSRRPRAGNGDAVRLGELLGRSWRTFSRLGQARFAASGLSGARVRLLLALADEPNSRMGDLARRLGVTARALTPVTDGLANDGLVERVVDPTDRRAFRLALTELGAGQAAEITTLRATISEEIFGGLTVEQRRQLERLLLAFVESAGDHEPTGTEPTDGEKPAAGEPTGSEPAGAC